MSNPQDRSNNGTTDSQRPGDQGSAGCSGEGAASALQQLISQNQQRQQNNHGDRPEGNAQ